MKPILLLICFIVLCAGVNAQPFTAARLIDGAESSKNKFENFIQRNNFISVGNDYKGDTIVKEFQYRMIKGGKRDSIERGIVYYSTKEDFCFSFNTLSAEEGSRIIGEFKKAGFYCNNEKDSLRVKNLLYQHNDLTAEVTREQVDTLVKFSFMLRKQPLPKPKEIKFAEDLSAFTSHEYLRFFFGEAAVKKDIYYLSDSTVGKCSILFPNSSRQAVFIWNDEINNTGLSKIYIGGQLKTGSAVDYDQNIAENLWQLRSGVHPGMSLYTLRLLNDAAFNFYGGNNAKTGMIFTDSTGKLNFKKENIILGCMNCNDRNFYKQAVISSDQALEEERILFVHTIILEPDKKRKLDN